MDNSGEPSVRHYTLVCADCGQRYDDDGLARMLDLPNLWIAFNGFWPERGAVFETATFKDLEAHTVLGRLDSDVILTVASAGNTGAAFAVQRVTALLETL